MLKSNCLNVSPGLDDHKFLNLEQRPRRIRVITVLIILQNISVPSSASQPPERRVKSKYRIRSNYRTYPYKRTVKQFRSLQITASVLFVYVFIKAYVVGTYLNCIDLSMQFK